MSRRNYPGKRLYRYREGDRRRQKLRKTERKAAKYRRSYTRVVPHQTGQRRVYREALLRCSELCGHSISNQ